MSTSTASPAKRTAMYHSHRELGAVLVERDGWQLPSSYASVEQEMALARSSGGVCDISPVGKLDVQGAQALEHLSRLFSLALALRPGRVVSSRTPLFPCVVSLAALAYDEALIFVPAEHLTQASGLLEKQLKGCVHQVDVTSVWAAVCVVGPRSPRLLSRLIELDLDPNLFLDGSCAQAKAAEVHVIIVRSDIATLPSYRLFVSRDYGEYLWHAILEVGRKEGVKPMGIEALERLTSGQG